MPAISGPPFCMDAMRKSMGKYKMTQEMGCITFETINSQVVLGCMSIIFVAGLHQTLNFRLLLEVAKGDSVYFEKNEF